MSEGHPEGEGEEQVQHSSEEGEQLSIELPIQLRTQNVSNKIKKGLSQIGKTYDGSGYSFINLNCDKTNLTELFDVLKDYKHLRKISFKDNALQNVESLSQITYLTYIDLSNNQIKDLESFAATDKLVFLESLVLQKNFIKELTQIGCPNLKHINLNNNKIESCEKFTGHATLECLELRKNKLQNCVGIEDMHNLNSLYLADNQLTTIEHLKDLPQLKILHLRKNDKLECFAQKIFKPEEGEAEGEQDPDQKKHVENQVIDESIDYLPTLPYLHTLNIRETKVATLRDIQKLIKFQDSLSTLVITGTPLQEEQGEGVKKEIIMMMPQLKKINKDLIEQEEVEEALKELKERRDEEERKRLEEEEEKKRLEQEALENAQKAQEEEEEQ